MNRSLSADSHDVKSLRSSHNTDNLVRISSRPPRDHSDEADNGDFSSSPVNGNTPKTFPEVLKAILSKENNKSAISWLPHGKAFLVLDRKKFVEEVLPMYLGKATKYTSFTRKLSRWNFARVANGPDEGAWFNKSFFRDDEVEKIREMKCAKRKKSHLKDFPSSRPLKKRPVDASLFKKLQSPSSSPEVQTSSMGGVASAYTYGGRPLALADTRSVVQAAMQALIHSQAGASPMAQLQQQTTTSNGVYPLMANGARQRPTLNTDVLAALQAATQRRGSPSSSTS